MFFFSIFKCFASFCYRNLIFSLFCFRSFTKLKIVIGVILWECICFQKPDHFELVTATERTEGSCQRDEIGHRYELHVDKTLQWGNKAMNLIGKMNLVCWNPSGRNATRLSQTSDLWCWILPTAIYTERKMLRLTDLNSHRSFMSFRWQHLHEQKSRITLLKWPCETCNILRF